MAKHALLPRLIHALDSEEHPVYVKWIEMELVGRPEMELEWFTWLYHQLSAANFPESVTKDDIQRWWHSFPASQELNPRAYERINDRFSHATERFLAYQESKNVPLQSDINLVYRLSKTGARKLFFRYYRKLRKRLQSAPLKTLNHQFLEAYRQFMAIGLEWQIMSDSKQNKGFDPIDLEEVYKGYENQIRFNHAKLILLKTVNLRDLSAADQYFLKELETYSSPAIPQLGITRTIRLWAEAKDPPSASDIQKRVESLLSLSEDLPKDQVFDYLASFLNILLTWERKHFRQDILKQRLNIYNQLMKLFYRQMPPIVYLNLMKGRVLELSCQYPLLSLSASGAWDSDTFLHLAQQLEQYRTQIYPSYREQAKKITDIHVEFEKGAVDKVLQMIAQLNQGPSPEKYFDLSIQWVQAKCYFLLEDGDSLISLLNRIDNRLAVLIKRDPKDSFAQSLKNACLILRKLYRAQFKSGSGKQIQHDINDLIYLEDRFWLSGVHAERFQKKTGA